MCRQHSLGPGLQLGSQRGSREGVLPSAWEPPALGGTSPPPPNLFGAPEELPAHQQHRFISVSFGFKDH